MNINHINYTFKETIKLNVFVILLTSYFILIVSNNVTHKILQQ